MLRARSNVRRSATGELLLEALDHRDRRGVDPPQDRDVERDEVAEQHERQDALYGLVAARGEAGAPEDVFVADRTLQILGLLWLLCFGVGTYVG